MNKPQQDVPSDWRKGGYRDAYEAIPRPPRKPTRVAKELIYAYQGSQRVLRIVGLVLIAITLPITAVLGGGLPSDIVLSIAGKQGIATIRGHHVVENVRVNNQHPIAVSYDFVLDGEKYSGESYTVHVMAIESLRVGDSLPIEYLSVAPSWSRARETTASMMGLSTLLFLLFPMIGLGLYGWARRANAREIRAFRDGTATKGLVTKRGFDVNTEINGEHPYEIVWEFHVDGARHTGKLQHMKREALDNNIPSDEVIVLYDVRDPKVNTVWLE